MNVTSIVLLAVALLLIVGVGLLLRTVLREVRDMTSELRALRLDSRARISTVAVRNGADTESVQLRQLRRLGRQTRGKRIVVGGDPLSEQHMALSRQVVKSDDDE